MSVASIRDYRAIVSGERSVDVPKKWTIAKLAQLAVYITVCFLLLLYTNNALWDPEVKAITLTLGALGIWRYSWWFTHVVRAEIYGKSVYPRIRDEAKALWDSGWRPRHVHFMMTTFKERRDTTELVLQSICREVRESGIPTTLWLGSGDVVLMGGDARLTYHGVDRIKPGSSTLLRDGGRINLTLRVVD